MKWVDLERIDFRGNGALLIVSRIDAINYSHILAGVEGWRTSESPHELLKLIRELIDQHRPELKGCYVWAMWFDVQTRDWKIGVEHESLPAAPPGACLHQFPLVPEPMPAEVGK